MEPFAEAMPETIFSFADERPFDEPIPASDDVGALQPGLLVYSRGREICFVRRLAARDAVLQSDGDFHAGDRIALELLTGLLLSGAVTACREGEVRLRFDRPTDLVDVIAGALLRQPGDPRRPARIELRCSAWIEAGSRGEMAMTRDLSEGGMRIETPLPLVTHEPVSVTLDGFRTIEGMVRWVDGSLAGIAFTPELGWQELLPWLRRRGACAGADVASSKPSRR